MLMPTDAADFQNIATVKLTEKNNNLKIKKKREK